MKRITNQTKPNFLISLVEKHFQELELCLQSVFQVVLLSWGVDSFEALRPMWHTHSKHTAQAAASHEPLPLCPWDTGDSNKAGSQLSQRKLKSCGAASFAHDSEHIWPV